MNECSVQTDNSTLFSICHYFPKSNERMKTKGFLVASGDAVFLIEQFGKVFSPVTHDMKGNIQKLTSKYEEDSTSNMYLEEMIIGEQSAGKAVATDALLWLKRGLNFLSYLFSLIIEDSNKEPISNDLSPLLKKAYAATLEPYHGWLGVQLFNILSRFMPYRRQLMYTMAVDRHDCDELVLTELKSYNDLLAVTVQRLTEFYIHHGLETPNV